MKNKDEKVFLIVNSYFIGDILLVNPLIQNIKRIYKNSKIVMLTSPKLQEVSKYQQSVDDTIVWDRHGKDNGFVNMMKFIFKFPYKNIYAAFPIYGTDRPILLSFLLGAKYILFRRKKNIYKIFLKKKYSIKPYDNYEVKTQYDHLSLLEGITKEKIEDCRMVYNIDPETKTDIDDLKDYITLSPISSRKSKDIPYETIKGIIEKIDKKVVLLGGGKESSLLSEKLKQENFDNLIDCTNKTTIQQAGKIIQNSLGSISSDTGLMHLACALNKPVVGVFYEKNLDHFKPSKQIYKAETISENQTPENIIKKFQELTK